MTLVALDTIIVLVYLLTYPCQCIIPFSSPVMQLPSSSTLLGWNRLRISEQRGMLEWKGMLNPGCRVGSVTRTWLTMDVNIQSSSHRSEMPADVRSDHMGGQDGSRGGRWQNIMSEYTGQFCDNLLSLRLSETVNGFWCELMLTGCHVYVVCINQVIKLLFYSHQLPGRPLCSLLLPK